MRRSGNRWPGCSPDSRRRETNQPDGCGVRLALDCRLGFVDVVVEAFRLINLPLVIMGDGPERGRLRARARPNVRFVGTVADLELAAY